MRVFSCLSLLCSLLFSDDFINKFEYGEMLYKNPRGVSCEGCHGAFGEGQNMGKITKNKKEYVIIAPNIQKSNLEQIKKSMSSKKSVMPLYFLTDIEIDAIVYYIKQKNERVKKDLNQTK